MHPARVPVPRGNIHVRLRQPAAGPEPAEPVRPAAEPVRPDCRRQRPNTAGQEGLFRSLFDFGFEHFITPIIVKVVYILATIGLVLGWLIFMIAGFSQSAGAGLALLVLGPIGLILYLAFIRMTLEFYLAIVRMSEDIHQRLR